MSWSLLNSMLAAEVDTLLSKAGEGLGENDARGISKEKALAAIHGIIWLYACRDGSTASAYASFNLFEALGLKDWSFDDEEAKAFQEVRAKMWRDRAIATTPPPDDPAPGTAEAV